MGRKPTGNPNGRPPKTIDWDEFDKLCALQCTINEFRCFLDMSEDTIERNVKKEKGMSFAEYFDLKRGTGKISLRRMMYQKAQSGNTTMQVWLSKNYLGYTERVEQKVNHSGSIGVQERSRAVEKIFGDERSQELALELAERMSQPEKAEGESDG